MAAKFGAVLLAGGTSQRFGADKLRLNLGGKPVFRHALDTFLNHPDMAAIVVVGPSDLPVPADVLRAEPGTNRAGSVRNGLAALPTDLEFVLIHDLARPLLPSSVIDAVIAKLQEGATAVGCGRPVTDTVRRGNDIVDREGLFAMQTPQAASLRNLQEAHAQFADEVFTDDLEYLARAGHDVTIVPGSPQNLKITTPADMETLHQYAAPEFRTGLGYDIHAFSADPTRPLWLGGRHFPGERGLEGHSDADALLHAVVDALLGAANLGDIGFHYPNTDPRWKDRPSIEFLRESAAMLRDMGWGIVNIDATVLAEAPKILPFRLEICATIADAAGISAENVSLKATTHEGLGAIGRREGIAAMATATIRR